MPIDRLKRVLWRCREKGYIKEGRVSREKLRLAIMYECGTDPSTISKNITALKILKWIKGTGKGKIYKVLVSDLEI